MNDEGGYKPSWMQCSDRYGCGRWFRRMEDFDAHMEGYARRCRTDQELDKRGVAFLRPEARAWLIETGSSAPNPRKEQNER